MMKRPFLDDWIARCCGLEVLSEESLRRYQLNKINEVLRYTERNSLLYRKRLAGVFERHGEAIRAGMWPASPDGVTQLPFTTARDLEDGWKRFVCVPLDAIARMGARRVVYVSCNPDTLARDVRYMRKLGYAGKEAWGVDLFPFTRHVETVVLMSRVKG